MIGCWLIRLSLYLLNYCLRRRHIISIFNRHLEALNLCCQMRQRFMTNLNRILSCCLLLLLGLQRLMLYLRLILIDCSLLLLENYRRYLLLLRLNLSYLILMYFWLWHLGRWSKVRHELIVIYLLNCLFHLVVINLVLISVVRLLNLRLVLNLLIHWWWWLSYLLIDLLVIFWLSLILIRCWLWSLNLSLALILLNIFRLPFQFYSFPWRRSLGLWLLRIS